LTTALKRVGIICGGSGSSKFASAFSDHSREDLELDLGLIANVADNYWYHGLYVCPDVDIITHALAGNLDTSKGWGVASDTFTGQQAYSKMSDAPEWFNLGDFDSALCQRRTELMKNGWTLSTVTDYFCNTFKIKHKIIPSTDDSVQTFMMTTSGLMHLQQYWVEHGALPEAKQILCLGSEVAKPNPAAISYISQFAIICPANPVTSILPSIRITGMEKVLKKSRVVAISPFVGDKPFSGPATKLMSVIGVEPSSLGVARLYQSFLKLFILDTQEDSQIVSSIKDLGIECVRTNTRVNENSRLSVAREIMGLL
jgi:LPPG:FO 2-phospho-L-lactate transferase